MNSNNTHQLVAKANELGSKGYHVEHAEDVRPEWLVGKRRVGLTAGASAPDILVQQVIATLRAMGAVSVRTLQGVEETVRFPLPMGLGDKSMQQGD